MFFDLEVLIEGRKRVFRYENVNTRVVDLSTGKELLVKPQTFDYPKTTHKFDIDFSNIAILFINLGLKCNFSCKYCHQNHFRETTQVANCTPEKARQLLKILGSLPKLNMQAISLWGGEPLVYWKSFKVLIPGLRELFPDKRISLTTNGSLLNDEILDFLSKYNIRFTISYDGKITNRDESIFDRKELVDSLRKLGMGLDIMTTQNRASIPIKAIREEFSQMGLPLKSISTYSIARCNPFNRDQAQEILIPRDKCERHSQLIYEILHGQTDSLDLYKGLPYRFDYILGSFYTGQRLDSQSFTFCGNCNGSDVCIDCEGKIFNCMNIPIHVMGTLQNFKPVDTSKIFNFHYQKKACLSCPYVTCCRGGCPLIHDDESVEFKVNCSNLKITAVPFFRTMIERIFGAYLKRIVRVSDGKVFGEW